MKTIDEKKNLHTTKHIDQNTKLVKIYKYYYRNKRETSFELPLQS